MTNDVIKGSRSVAVDLQIPEPQEADIKSKLAARLMILIQTRGLSGSEAARVIGADEVEITAILEGRYSEFSIYCLMSYLRAFDQDIEIAVRPKADREARVCVIAD